MCDMSRTEDALTSEDQLFWSILTCENKLFQMAQLKQV